MLIFALDYSVAIANCRLLTDGVGSIPNPLNSMSFAGRKLLSVIRIPLRNLGEQIRHLV